MGHLRLATILLLVVALVLGVVPMAVTAQSGIGGAVVVEEGETVESVEAFAGSIVVEQGATVTGDVSGVAGDVRIEGSVEGDVNVAAGNLEISGTVGGDVNAGAGTVTITETGAVVGSVTAGAGEITIAGEIDGDATLGADTIFLEETATIQGDLTYGGSLEGDTGVVQGEITEDESLGPGAWTDLGPVVGWVFFVYGIFLNLLLGAVLLGLFPRFSDGVADRVAGDPLRTGGAGLLVLIGVPLVLVAIALSIVGIPISIVGALVFALVAWIGLVYGRFAVAAWLLSLVDLHNRWLALLVGILGGALLTLVPFVGGLLNLLVFLLGLGALAVGLYRHGRRSRTQPAPGEPAE